MAGCPGIRHQTSGFFFQKQPYHLVEETGVQRQGAASFDIMVQTWALNKKAQNKLAAALTEMERHMLNITYKDRKSNLLVRQRTKVIDIISNVKPYVFLGIAHTPHQRRPMYLSSHHLETIRQENTTRETSQLWRRPEQIPEGQYLAEDSTIQANLETACGGIPRPRSTTAVQ